MKTFHKSTLGKHVFAFLAVLLYFKYCVLDQRKKLYHKYINFTVETFEVFRSRIIGVSCTTWKDGMSVQSQIVVDVGERRLCNFWIFYVCLKWLSPCRNNLPQNVVDACVIIYRSLFYHLQWSVFIYLALSVCFWTLFQFYFLISTW